MSAELQGVPQLRARITALTPNEGLMRTLALASVREQKIMVPRKTGNLGRSIHLGAVSATRAETIASAHYAAYVERGTRAHIITPKRAKALAWPAGAGSARLSGRARTGSPVRFAKRVRHPGTKARPFMVPGAQKALAGVGLRGIMVELWDNAA